MFVFLSRVHDVHLILSAVRLTLSAFVVMFGCAQDLRAAGAGADDLRAGVQGLDDTRKKPIISCPITDAIKAELYKTYPITPEEHRENTQKIFTGFGTLSQVSSYLADEDHPNLKLEVQQYVKVLLLWKRIIII